MVVRQAGLLTDPLPEAAYDAVVSLSALHHLPLHAGLPRLATALRPGGRLIAVALPRVELPHDLPVELAAVGAQAAVAAALGLARLAGVPALVKDDDGMPVVAPELIVQQVRRQARTNQRPPPQSAPVARDDVPRPPAPGPPAAQHGRTQGRAHRRAATTSRSAPAI